MTETFTDKDLRENAVAEALRFLRAGVPPGLSPEIRQRAIENLEKRDFTTYTVSSEEMGIFHHYKEQAYVDGKPAAGEIARDETWKLP